MLQQTNGEQVVAHQRAISSSITFYLLLCRARGRTFNVRKEMEELIVKLFLLALVAIPFAALLSDMLGRTDGLMSRAVIGVTITLIFGMVFGGFQERPNFAHLVSFAFCAWPVFLLIAKVVRPTMSWYSIWVSVTIMSWFLTNLSVGLTDGNPLRGVFGLLFGWINMVIPFGILSALFVGIQRFLRRIRRCEQAVDGNPH